MAREIAVTLEIITPLFMGGTDTGMLADAIRVPSIRGQIRYWLRALLGRSCDGDIKTLQKQEGYLMGDTKTGSLVHLRIVEPQSLLRTGTRRMLPHRQLSGGNPLLTPSFTENQAFQIVISPRPGLSEIPNQIMAALLLWLNLGGLGKRSRRGFGSLQVQGVKVEGVSVAAEALMLLQASTRTGVELQTHLKKVVTWCVGTVSETAVFTDLAPYPILSDKVANVMVCEAASDKHTGMKPYEQAMVPFWTQTLRNNNLADERAYGYAIRQARRASPFHLHIAKTGEDHHLLLTTFWAKPSPNGDAGWKKVERLLADCQEQWKGQIVWGRRIP